MHRIHFLNVLEGDCQIIEHGNSGRVSVIDISNAFKKSKIAELLSLDEILLSEETQKIAARGTKGNYNQKKHPENPIEYLNKFSIYNIWRLIITHPDMDHLDGLKDFVESLGVKNYWDTDNNKEIKSFDKGHYKQEDWDLYKDIRDNSGSREFRYLNLYEKQTGEFWTDDNITILAPTEDLIRVANESEDNGAYNDASYVLLYEPIKNEDENFKILFSSDSHDKTWEHILKNYKDDVSNVDVLVAPHHGRDSDRNYDFLKTVSPSVTLFGNASSKDLAYGKYPNTVISNNQAGNIVLWISDKIYFYCSNKKFADDYRASKGWDESKHNSKHDAYFMFNIG